MTLAPTNGAISKWSGEVQSTERIDSPREDVNDGEIWVAFQATLKGLISENV